MGRSQESFGLGVQEPVAVTRVISLGGGVQSTVLTLLADEGAFGPLPDCAIFADTGWEPSAVYDNIEWLKGRTSIPIHVVSNGRNLRDDMWEGLSSQGRPWVTLPVYTLSARGKQGMAKRQCTANYKIDPIVRRIREILGVGPGQQVPRGVQVELWLGISRDEALRMRDSRYTWMHNRYPLVYDRPMTRGGCQRYFKERFPGRHLPRSACVGCPFRSGSEWIAVKESDPEAFADAVALDARMRSEGYSHDFKDGRRLYLHQRRLPLDEAVAMDTCQAEATRLQGELPGFLNECEGHCGL